MRKSPRFPPRQAVAKQPARPPQVKAELAGGTKIRKNSMFPPSNESLRTLDHTLLVDEVRHDETFQRGCLLKPCLGGGSKFPFHFQSKSLLANRDDCKFLFRLQSKGLLADRDDSLPWEPAIGGGGGLVLGAERGELGVQACHIGDEGGREVGHFGQQNNRSTLVT